METYGRMFRSVDFSVNNSEFAFNLVATERFPSDVDDHSVTLLNNDSLSSNVSHSCLHDYVPSMHEYLQATDVAGVVLLTVGACGVVFILFLYAEVLNHVMRNAPSLAKAPSAFVLGVYSVVAVATYCATVVPRAQLVAEAVTQEMFMLGLYQFFCMAVAYCGGELSLVDLVHPNRLSTHVGPCCCWPCCCCVPEPRVGKFQLRILRLLVLQLPVVQGLVYLAELVVWAEEESILRANYPYFQPFIVVSLLSGIWGIFMTLKTLGGILKDFQLLPKFFVLQMILILTKLQGLIVRICVGFGLVPCIPPVSPEVYANMIYNSLIIGEMAILAVVARMLYKKTLPDELPLKNRIHVSSANLSDDESLQKDERTNCNLYISSDGENN